MSNKTFVALVLVYVVIISSAVFVGIVKFMAWWNVAFGDCIK